MKIRDTSIKTKEQHIYSDHLAESATLQFGGKSNICLGLKTGFYGFPEMKAVFQGKRDRALDFQTSVSFDVMKTVSRESRKNATKIV